MIEFYFRIYLTFYEMFCRYFMKCSGFSFCIKCVAFLRTNFRVKISACRRVFIARLLMTITTNGETLKGGFTSNIYDVFRTIYILKNCSYI